MSLTLKNIEKAFAQRSIFERFSYSFSQTGLYVISGNSGSGKTTLLRIICGIDKDFKGSVIDGGIGNTSVCFQEHRLFPTLSALKNVTEASFKKASDDDIAAAKHLLLKLKLSENDLSLLPSALSGGMKQRVAFARAVLKDAPILILDEPTKEVDPDICTVMRSIIAEEAAKRLVLLVTHNEDDLSDLEFTKIIING